MHTLILLKTQFILNRLFSTFFISTIALALLNSCLSYQTKKGEKEYNSSAYSSAIKHFEKVYRKNLDPTTALKLADSYYKIGLLDSSETFYEKVVKQKNVASNSIYSYAVVLMNNGKIDYAREYFINYLTLNPNDFLAKLFLSACNSILIKDLEQEITNGYIIDNQINAFNLEDYKNGNAFNTDNEVFLGKEIDEWTKINYQNLLLGASNESGNWISKKKIYGDLNGRFNEGPAAFTNDGNTVYFTRSNYCKNDQNGNNLKIFKATLINGKWKNLEEFPYNSDNYSIGQLTLSKDGNKLFFASNMPGGFGGTDLYTCTLLNGTWSKPENLGSTMNTFGNESFPYYDEEGNLFFTSDNSDLNAKLNVFITYNNGLRWVQPENINCKSTNSKDNFGFSFDPKNISKIISTQTKNNKGKSSVHQLIGNARIKGTKIPVEGVLIELTTGKTGEIIKLYSDEQGNFNFTLSPEINYRIYFKPKESFFQSESITTKNLINSTDFIVDLEVERIEINKSKQLGNPYFNIDKWDLTNEAKIELDKLIQVLKDNLSMKIEINSFMDILGTDKYNKVLSEKRALTAVKYIISQGIDASRLTFKGLGEDEMLNNCRTLENPCSEQQNAENRRTTFKVISY